MFARFLIPTLALIVAAPLVLAPVASLAQDAASKQDTTLKKEELDQLLAPIALYPDDLLSNVLMASTYPLEVVQAARWVKEPANAKLKGDDLAKALEKQDWDPSIKSLAQFPEVLDFMSQDLAWTQKLGDAVLAQEADIMDQIQFLRDKADEAGNLKSDKQQTVTRKSSGSGGKKYIYIEPASPAVVYVPVYQPTVVYGSWWYPSYPPYYWPPPAGGAFVSGFFWGAGVAVASSIWGWGNCNWGNRNININVNKYNKINVNRPKITSNKWKHDGYHRRGVKYNNNNVRQKYAKNDIRGGQKNRLDYRGHSGKQVLKPDGDRRPGARPKPGERPKAGGDKRPGGGPKAGDRKPGDRPSASKRPKPDKRPSTGAKKRPSKTAKKRPSTGPKKRPSSGSKKRKSNQAFSKPRKGSSARKHASRGRSSMKGRGGGGRRGGGGGRRGGGRRR
jgi:hypothetical protein